MAYGGSDGHVIDDVTWPWKVRTRDPNGGTVVAAPPPFRPDNPAFCV